MKNFILFFLFISYAKAQDTHLDCKYQRNEIDRFTKISYLETTPVRFYNMYDGVDLYFSKINGKKYLTVKLVLNNEVLCFKEKSSLYLLSENDQVVQLSLDPEKWLECGQFEIVAGMKFSTYILYYPITEKEINSLKGFVIKAMRFYATSGYKEFEKLKGPLKKEKIKTFFNDNLKCIE